MIYVNMINHDYRYECFELLRAYYNTDDIKFVDEAIKDDIYIESRIEKEASLLISTVVYKNNQQVASDCVVNIDDMFVNIKDKKKKIKTIVKHSLLKTLFKFSEKKAPWGILTGIRPTKIVHKLMDLGFSEDDILNILHNEYLIEKDKSKLLMDVCMQERKYLSAERSNKYSLYISIPFCPTRCVYCSFPSNSIDKFKNKTDDYVKAVISEISETAKIMQDKVLNTVYIGGGTPTSLSPKQLEEIIQAVRKYFPYEIEEFTVEAGRPDTITLEMLKMLKINNIDRISINPQTMNDKTLQVIGRKHTSQDIVTAYNMAKSVGFASINMDLIVGLPGETVEDVENTMKQIYELKPSNLTVHTLAIKRASKLKSYLEKYPLASGSDIEKMIKITQDWAYKMGMKPYYMYRQKQMLGNFENVGYCMKDTECVYNIMIMEERQTIMALGAGGVSKVVDIENNSINRVPNVKDIYQYFDRVKEMVERKRNAINEK